LTKKKIHIDDFFRRGLGNMQMPVASNDFANMQTLLLAAQKRRKRRFIWLWLVGTLAVAGIATGIYSYNSTYNTLTQNPSTVANNVASTPPANGLPTENTAKENSLPAANNKTTDNTTAQNQSSQSIPKKQPASNKSISPNNTTQKTESKPITTNNTGDESKNERQVILTDIEPNSLENKDDHTPQVTAKDTNNYNQTGTKEMFESALPHKVEEGDTTKTEDEAAPVDSNKTIKPKDKGKEIEEYITPPFSLSINAGPALSTFGIGNAGQYNQIRSNGDKPGVGFNGAITINYNYKGFSFSTGLGYNSVAGKGNYNYTHQIYDSFPVLSPPPNPVIIGYVHTNFRDTTHNYTLQNRFTYITLPIAASYAIKITKNSGVRVGAGLQLQRLAGTSGEYINPANLFKFELDTKGDFIRKWNVNTRLSVGYYFKLSKLITLDMGINYSQMMGNLLGKDANVAVRPRSVGFEAGLRYNLLK
jgi:hypothetical protein